MQKDTECYIIYFRYTPKKGRAETNVQNPVVNVHVTT